jgi:hypothetical protein
MTEMPKGVWSLGNRYDGDAERGAEFGKHRYDGDAERGVEFGKHRYDGDAERGAEFGKHCTTALMLFCLMQNVGVIVVHRISQLFKDAFLSRMKTEPSGFMKGSYFCNWLSHLTLSEKWKKDKWI